MSLKGKLVLIGLGVGVGYILGAKAGRERYDQIAKATSTVWNAPLVKDVREASSTFMNNRLDDLGGLLKRGASSVIDRATGKRKRVTAAAARKPSTATKRASSSTKPRTTTKSGAASKSGTTTKSAAKPAKAADAEAAETQ